jgi:hypothetical protein
VFKLITLNKLKQHEEINKNHFRKLFLEIKQNNYVEPIIVDIHTNIILDGHHRYNIIKKLGYNTIPVILVDYKSQLVNVKSWKPKIKITKKDVVDRGLTGKLYPPKTSRHIIRGIKTSKINLNTLEVKK